ncbi:MAG: cysteine--1-D-myo-inosityl 2-amino-2-deoxy-alpha-D-glucopyranoside ligase [Jiangellaceae bacterium]|nr:cysteine--1-D-myo-inosityl 2-amino-2-deoxy-alpha-D-glucopyranoside ligase [Jiangellaceae bacterium]
MRSWPRAAVPELPGRAPLVRLHDTATGTRRVATSGTMYVCGITPYDATHLGHVATYLAFDVLNRVWRDGGLSVQYVQNVTDIDDPLLERAAHTGRDWAELAQEQTELFGADMAWLRVLPPEALIGAAEAMPLIGDLIGQLRAAGAAYDLDGDLYFPVEAEPRFGELSGLSRTRMLELFAERGGDPGRAGKKHPLDCLLWARERPGEPAWDSAFGRGRPGWHVECAAIALAELGMGFDVQGGGSDLVFPHHEMSAAQAQVATNSWPFARAYVHAGMIGLGGEKMAKSEGNLVLASRLRMGGADPDALRLALLADHYRADRDWMPALLSAAADRLARWRAATRAPAGPDATPVLATMRSRLADDLDTPAALATVDEWAAAVLGSGGVDPAAPALVRDAVDALLGVDVTRSVD